MCVVIPYLPPTSPLPHHYLTFPSSLPNPYLTPIQLLPFPHLFLTYLIGQYRRCVRVFVAFLGRLKRALLRTRKLTLTLTHYRKHQLVYGLTSWVDSHRKARLFVAWKLRSEVIDHKILTLFSPCSHPIVFL